MTERSSNRIIVRNSIMLYVRMLLTVVVGLYTSRVVLSTLGVEDFGIYGVVGGIVAMFSFLNASMSGATSRFLTYELGKGDNAHLAKTFSNALLAHLLIVVVILLLSETIGLWFLCNKLVISSERMYAAHIVYQLSIISAIFNITQVPYNSCLIAHEKMDVYAYVEMLNVSLKLLIVFLLGIGGMDKLIMYAILVLCVSAVIMLIYRIYCIHNFSECKFRFSWDKDILKSLLAFSGWNVYSALCYTGRQQGFNFILNVFGGTVLNAAAGLAATVDGVVSGFAGNIIMAFRSPLIKLYAVGDKHRTENLLHAAMIISLLLYFIVVVPLIVNADFILHLWLGNVPAHTVHFLRIILIASSFSILNNILLVIIHAVGTIKINSLLAGSISLLILVPLYVLLKKGINVDIAYGVVILSNLLITIVHICCIRRMVQWISIVRVAFMTFVLIGMECSMCYLLGNILSDQDSLLKTGLSFTINLIIVFALSLLASTKAQRDIVRKYVHEHFSHN